MKKGKGLKKWLIPLVLLLTLALPFGSLSAFAAYDECEGGSDVVWNYVSYEDYAEKMVGMKLDKTDQTVQFYNTFVDQKKLGKSTTIDTLFDSSQEGYSTELLLTLNPVQLTEQAPVFKGEDGNYYVVTSVYEMNNGLEPKDSQPATSFYNYLAEAFTDVEYIGKGVFRIPAERYDYCFNGHYYTDGPEGNIVEVVFGLRIQSLYGYDPETMPVTKTLAVSVMEGKEKRLAAGILNMETGTIEVQLLSDESEENIKDYDIEAVVNRGEGTATILSIAEDGKTVLFAAGDSHAIGAFDIAIAKEGKASTGLITDPVIKAEQVMMLGATKLASSSTTVINNITYLVLPEGCVPSNLAVGDKFIYEHKNVYIAAVQNANDGGNYGGMTGTYNGQNPPTNLHVGSNNIFSHDAQWFCFYNYLNNWNPISNWFKQDSTGYSALNDPLKPDTNTAVENSMRQMTTANMNLRAQNNGTSGNLGGQHAFGYISEKLTSTTDTTGTKTLNLNEAQLIFGCMHAWAYEGSTTPTAVGQALATFAGTSEIAHDQYCGNYYPNLGLQCTSVTVDGNYTNATFKCCTSILGVGGIYANNRNNYQCAFSTLYVRFPNAKGEVTVEKVWDDEDDTYFSRPDSVTMTLWSNVNGSFASTGKTVTLSSTDDWASKTFTDLPIYQTGSSTTKVQYYVVEAAVNAYETFYSSNGADYSESASTYAVYSGGTLYVLNSMNNEPGTPYGVTTITKTVRENGQPVTNSDEFLFRIDIQYRATTTDGLVRTEIESYDHVAAIRYFASGSTTSAMSLLSSDAVKDSIVFDNSKPVSIYCVLKGGESVTFRIYDDGGQVSITELAANDPDLVAVASFLGKSGGFSDRYIASYSSTVSAIVPGETTTWGSPVAGGSGSNPAVLQNLSASYTVDADKRDYSFINDCAYDLTLQKVIVGNMASRKDQFTMSVTLKNANGNPMNGTFRTMITYTGNNGTVSEAGQITFTNGVASISLRGGSSLVIKGIPSGSHYVVSEQDYTSAGYITTYQNKSGTVLSNAATTVKNKRDGVVPTGIHTNALPIIGSVAAVMILLFGILVFEKAMRKNHE